MTLLPVNPTHSGYQNIAGELLQFFHKHKGMGRSPKNEQGVPAVSRNALFFQRGVLPYLLAVLQGNHGCPVPFGMRSAAQGRRKSVPWENPFSEDGNRYVRAFREGNLRTKNACQAGAGGRAPRPLFGGSTRSFPVQNARTPIGGTNLRRVRAKPKKNHLP